MPVELVTGTRRLRPLDRVEIVRRIISGPIVVDHERILCLPEKEGTPEAVAIYQVRDGRITQTWFPPKR